MTLNIENNRFMNIVLATDNNFVQHCTVAMLSILRYNKGVHFYILSEGLNIENEDYMKQITKVNSAFIDFCKVPSDIIKYFPMSSLASSHISIATYYRLFMTSLLPETVNKVIYLDCDMIIRGSLDELWNIDLTGYALGAVYQDLGWSDHNDCWERLRIPRNRGYFNAGCLLVNMEYFRMYNFQERAVSYINHNFKRIISHDQDVLNALLYDKTFMLDCKWNFLSGFLSKKIYKSKFPIQCKYIQEITDARFDPVIVHFVSKPKPWHYGCRNPYTNEYYYYLRQTRWKDFTPKFDLHQYINFVIVPSVKRAIKFFDFFKITESRHLQKVRMQYCDE